jgi:hypothetical protein
MPTYAELQAETWWGREIVPDPLRELGARLCTASSAGRPGLLVPAHRLTSAGATLPVAA